MITLKICVGVFSEILKARMLKLGIHIDNELLYCWIENQTPCFYSSFYLSIFLSFKAKFVSQFSPEMYKLESSNMVYICRMSDYIAGLRLVGVFSGIFKARMLKLCIHMDNELLYYGIENRTPCSYSSLYLSIFIQFSLFLHLDCLEFVLQFSLQLILFCFSAVHSHSHIL